MELCISLELLKGCQASSRVQVGNLGFFPTSLLSCCEGILGVPLELGQGNQDLFQVEGDLGDLFPCSRISGVSLEFE